MSYYLKLSLRKRFLLYFVLALNGMLVMGTGRWCCTLSFCRETDKESHCDAY